jgi:hydroxymethylpyrimidine/phosphomethylpyrimidine kinase
LAKGLPLPKAIGLAKKFVTRAIKDADTWRKVTALNQVQR